MGQNTATTIREDHKVRTSGSSWSDLSVHVYIKIFIIGALLWYLYRAEIYNIVSKWSDPSWSHGFLIPFFSLYFINQKKEQILNVQPKTSYLGFILLVGCLLFYPLNVVHFQYGTLKPLTMIATIGAVVLFLGGWRLLKYTWLPVGFLVFAVPPPDRYYVALTMPMRKLAASVAKAILNIVPELDATAEGVVIDVMYQGKPLEPALNVAEACSGMRLLMAFVALGVAMAYLHYRPLWQRLVLLVSTVPIAIFCNMVRVTTTGFIYILWEPKYAQGIYHDGLGMSMLLLAFGLYGLLAWFMSELFVEETEETNTEDVIVRRD